MKKFYLIHILFFFPLAIFFNLATKAQCPPGSTQAQVNWDKLDVYFNNGSNVKPYGYATGTYVTDAMEMTQKFALGPNYVTIATSSNAVINPGAANGVTDENTTHTGDLPGYTGADVQYNPSAVGQTITFTFNTQVRNLTFTLYDVDAGQQLNFNAQNSLGVGQNINVVLQGVTNLAVTNNNTPTAFITSNGTNAANNVNTNSATINVAGPLKTFTITVGAVGFDAVFWLSDITACVTGSFATSYHQTGSNQPMTGPTQNQPDYFIITPDNDSAFMVDPATGKAWFLFADPANTYMNSFGYDPYNHYLYYISEGTSLNPNNKSIKKFDFNTNAISTVIADITTLNIPTFNSGVESAAGAYYNGNYFFGVEGGQYDASNTRESIIYRVDLDVSGNFVNACQVFATNAYNGSTSIHDWGDVVIKDGVLYDYNSRFSGILPIVSYEHYDMMTGQSVQYNNPSNTAGFAFQAGMTWSKNLYSFKSGNLNRYFENGTIGPDIPIVSMSGTTWKTGAGDASENFRPKCDFGDAPATYDPNPISPAVHERTDSIRLGPTWDNEWVKRGVIGNNDVDDGIGTVSLLTPGANYLVQVNAYNNSGSNATLIAWLDYNANGVFDASEACTPITVPSSSSLQPFNLFWPSVSTPLTPGQTTYLRVRITSASAGMTTANATGYFFNGEVEDYKVTVDNFPLAVNLLSFDASVASDKKVKLSWSVSEDGTATEYEILRSSNSIDWQHVGFVSGNHQAGVYNYNLIDSYPFKGTSFYRLKITSNNGSIKYSAIKTIHIKNLEELVTLSPNPTDNKTVLAVDANKSDIYEVRLLNNAGSVIWKNKFNVVAGKNLLDIPLNKYPEGTYVVQLVTPEGILNKQVVKN